MKIIITERQKKLITEKIDENKLRDFCYKLWNKQKEIGEEPHIDDIIYQVSGIEERSSEDYYVIRPIWYEYNGGYNKLFNRMKDEILDKIFNLNTPDGVLNTQFHVVEVLPDSDRSVPIVDIYCNVDNEGTMNYETYDEEIGQHVEVNGSLGDAYDEAIGNYEGGDFKSTINYYVYDYLSEKLKKYGLSIDTDIELVNFN